MSLEENIYSPCPIPTNFFHVMFAEWDPTEVKKPLPFIFLPYKEGCNSRKCQKRVYKEFSLPYIDLKTIQIAPIREWVSREQLLGILQYSEHTTMQLIFASIPSRSIIDNVFSYNVFDGPPLHKSKLTKLTQT